MPTKKLVFGCALDRLGEKKYIFTLIKAKKNNNKYKILGKAPRSAKTV